MHRSWTNKEKPFCAKLLPSQYMTFCNELRKDAFIDILKIQTGSLGFGQLHRHGRCRVMHSRKFMERPLVVAGGVNGLDFHRNKTLKIPVPIHFGQNPID